MIPKLLLIPFIVAFLTQASKFVWFSIGGQWDWRKWNFYGGMPSTHTALMTSLTSVIAFQEGVDSAGFAVALIMTLIVISDALGYRRYIGSHSRALNIIVQELPEEDQRHIRHFREHFGHTPLEVFVGMVLGFALSSVFYMLIT